MLSLTIATLVLFSACSKNATPVPPDDPVLLEMYYNEAIRDAIIADSSEICNTLLPISSNNPKLEWRTINNEQYVLVGNYNRFPGSYSDTVVVKGLIQTGNQPGSGYQNKWFVFSCRIRQQPRKVVQPKYLRRLFWDADTFTLDQVGLLLRLGKKCSGSRTERILHQAQLKIVCEKTGSRNKVSG